MALKIGELARAAGAKPETVRYYETIGLIDGAERSDANYRLYGQRHLDRLGFIRRSRALGFSIEEVRQLLSLAEDRRARLSTTWRALSVIRSTGRSPTSRRYAVSSTP